jgi:hypothetical protein
MLLKERSTKGILLSSPVLLWRVCISCLSTCSRNQSRGCRSHGLVASAGISNEPFPHVTHPFVGCCCLSCAALPACRRRHRVSRSLIVGPETREGHPAPHRTAPGPRRALHFWREQQISAKKSCFRRGMRARP